MSEPKIVFIDIDGTLIGDDQTLLPSTIKAVKDAKANGHLLFLCTGRSKPELHDYILELGFSGYICANGGSIEMNDQILLHKEMDQSVIRDIVDFFDKHNVDFYLESRGGLYASKNCVKHILDICDLKNKEDHVFTNVVIEGADLYREDVSKICFLSGDIPYTEVYKRYKEQLNVMYCTIPLFGKESGELAVKGVSKASAIEFLLDYLKVKNENTIAIGDGINDFEMLEYCNTGIAMGNADERLKAIADFVSDDVDHDGFYKAFKHYHLI